MVKDAKKEGQWHRIDSKESAKALFGVNPKVKVALRTDRLMPRKNYPSLIRSMARIMVDRPNTHLLIHCRYDDLGGFLPDTVSKFPHIMDQVHYHEARLERPALAALYNAADVYVSTSAEGFGLTIAEAIACGAPAVGLEYSAVPEVIGPAGVVVPIETLTDNEYDHFWARPDEEKFAQSVAWFLDHPKRARETGANGPRHVRSNFTWEKAADVFVKVLT